MGVRPFKLSVEDAMQMLRLGIVPEDATTELLDGQIVYKDRSGPGADPRSHSPRHANAIMKLTTLAGRTAHRIQIQLPIVCGDYQMPEPDFAVTRGNDQDYTGRLPTAADVHCVVEVADSSLERDRDEKGPIYAAAGIRQYVILDLRNRTAEVYADPVGGAYPPATVIGVEGVIDLRIGDGEFLPIPLIDLLP